MLRILKLTVLSKSLRRGSADIIRKIVERLETTLGWHKVLGDPPVLF